MTLTVRSASITGATTAARALTHAEMDANWAHVIDSSNHSFLQSGTGATSRSVQAKLRLVEISPEDFGAEGDGTTDDTDAVQACATAIAAIAEGQRPKLKLKSRYLVSESINITARMCIEGDGDGTGFVPTISDGTPVLNFSSMRTPKLANFTIISGIVAADFLTGSADGQNCIGIKFHASLVTRWDIDNVRIQGLKTACDFAGHIGTAKNLFIEYCETGLIGSGLNAVWLNLRMENNRKDFAITDSFGLTMAQYLSEGANSATVTSTLDNCHGVTFENPYLEWATNNRDTPFITVGATTECSNFKISAGYAAAASLEFGTYPIALDNVDGADIDLRISTSTRNVSVSTTSNTKNYRLNGRQSETAAGFHDGSKQLGPCFNYFSNRNFDLWFRGWGVVAPTRCTFAQETTIVRKGSNAVKITATSGQTNNNLQWQLSGPSVTYLRGRTVKVYAWIWVPDISDFDEETASASRMKPALYVGDFDGSNAQLSTARTTGYKKGAWNFMESGTITVQSDATRIDVIIYVNNTGTINADGDEYIVVDSVYLVEGSTPHGRVLNDDILDSPYVDAIAVGGRMILSATAAPTDTDQVFEVGDTVLKRDVASGGSPAWSCTTGGAGGTAVFKAWANVA